MFSPIASNEAFIHVLADAPDFDEVTVADYFLARVQ